ncbi:hypothetical protein AURDEDRAFT_128018 [Auricularia subglabra TFB-10046 SS5]|nr:hypothetical protein AURDEDRAFT_128018 [Auricularia subglabra TFB-10046 SS5]
MQRTKRTFAQSSSEEDLDESSDIESLRGNEGSWGQVASEKEPFIIRTTGPWSYERFGRLVLHIANDQGDDAALATLSNSFPRVGTNDALLWLAYLKSAKGKPLDPCIMNGFRTISYYKALKAGGDIKELFASSEASAAKQETHALQEQLTSVRDHYCPSGVSNDVGYEQAAQEARAHVQTALYGPVTIHNITINQNL